MQAALDRDIGTHDIDDVWAAIESGAAQLWPYPNSALVTTIEDYPKAKALRWWLVGGVMDEVLSAEPIIAEWAVRQGCTIALAGGRRGWVRVLPEYAVAHTVIFRKLT